PSRAWVSRVRPAVTSGGWSTYVYRWVTVIRRPWVRRLRTRAVRWGMVSRAAIAVTSRWRRIRSGLATVGLRHCQRVANDLCPPSVGGEFAAQAPLLVVAGRFGCGEPFDEVGDQFGVV